MTAQSWMISLGHASPPPDARRLNAPIIDGEEKRLVTEYDKYQGFFISKNTKKIRRGMSCLVKKGMNNNSEIFRILIERGFTYIPRTGRNYSVSTLSQYMIYVRKYLKIPVVQKQFAILELLKEGKSESYIVKKLETSTRYIQEVNSNFNLKKGKKNV